MVGQDALRYSGRERSDHKGSQDHDMFADPKHTLSIDRRATR